MNKEEFDILNELKSQAESYIAYGESYPTDFNRGQKEAYLNVLEFLSKCFLLLKGGENS